MRVSVVLATSALLLTAALAVAPATAFHANGMPVVHAEEFDGNGAVGIKIVSDGSDYAVDLEAYGPVSSSVLSAGMFEILPNGAVGFGFAFSGLLSPDRLTIMPLAETDAAAVPSWLTVEPYTREEADGTLVMGLGLSATNPPVGSQRYVLWVGGGATSALIVRGTGVQTVMNTGEAYTLGDPELAGGVNAQVQETGPSPAWWLSPQAGVKVMKDASYTMPVSGNLYGFWGIADFKLACQFAAGACVWKSGVDYTCWAQTGVKCDRTSISWTGPSGTQSGWLTYAFYGEPAGDYTVTVDEKIDTYGPGMYQAETGTFVFAGENFSYLTAADVVVPQ